MNKGQTFLYIYDLLNKKGYITKEEIMGKANISELTFKRYIKDIRDYLEMMRVGKTIVYSKKDLRYHLISKTK